MNMRWLLIIVILVSIQTSSAAVTDIDISNVLPSLITQGGNLFLQSLGDQLYEMTGAKNATQAQTGIALYMSEKDNFIESKGVQDQKDFNALWFMIAYFIYLGYGAARISSEKTGSIGFSAHEGYTGTYIKTLVTGIVFFVFYLYGLDFLLIAEWVVADGFITNAMNIMPTDVQYGLVYLIIAIGNVGVWIFLLLRKIIVYVVFMYLLWLLVFRKLPIAGYAISLILMYGVTLFLSRIIIAFIFMAGTGALEGLGIGGLVLPYIVLMFFILLICLFLLILPYILIKGGVGMTRGRSTTHIHNHYGANGSDSYGNEEILHE